MLFLTGRPDGYDLFPDDVEKVKHLLGRSIALSICQTFGATAAANRLGEWAAAGQPASCVSLCRALATLDKAVEMKVNFYAAASKDGLR
jgi:hypothetical protein